MKHLFVNAILLFAAICASAQILLPTEEGSRISLNGTWDFKFMNEEWRTIEVPGNWEMQGVTNARYGEKKRDLYGEYHRTLDIPRTWKGKRIHLCFEGVQFAYSVWVNGDSVGTFSSSFNRKTFDITKYAKAGKTNDLTVKVWTNPKEWAFDTNDDWTLSGIYRDVTLFCLPKTHIEDLTVKTFTDGRVIVDAKTNGKKYLTRLIDANGKQVAEGWNGECRIEGHPVHLWTAETPYLYTLQVELYKGKKVVQTHEQKIGIREITWKDGVLKVNGNKIMLKGVNHHDLSPDHGRGLYDEELLKDLTLMKEGNINFIRCAHYPPQPRLLELADSMGLYVLDEIPFGFGDKNLKDDSFLPILKERALYTFMRDKNHPSVITWGVGNENPLTPICMETGKYVKELDETRPFCFPQTPSVFKAMLDSVPEYVELFDYHYPVTADLKEVLPKLQGRSMMASEYAHALGLDMGEVENIYEEMRRHDCFSGGAVWMMFDQGILRHADKPVDKSEPTTQTWLTPTTYYDTNGNQGTDGVMYANRVPQVCYYELRKVFTPVKAADDFKMEGNTFSTTVENRYDFLNLNTMKGSWKLCTNRKVVKSGILTLDCPHGNTTDIRIALPNVAKNAFNYLVLEFEDNSGIKVYEKSYLLTTPDLTTITTGDTLPSYLQESIVRVGRKESLASTATQSSRRSKVLHTLWKPFLQESGDFKKDVEVTKNPNGSYTFTYEVTLLKDMETIECGLSFIVPESLTEMRYAGYGPYAAYSNRNRLSEFGIHHLHSSDLYFPGNRPHTRLFSLTNPEGEGFAIIADDANICVERSKEGIIVSHNAFVAGVFNKYEWPLDIRTYKAGESFKGSFTIVPLGQNWSQKLVDLLGSPAERVKPFTPFYHSYDQ